jgi:ribokinase
MNLSLGQPLEPHLPPLQMAVVGHVEWVEFLWVDHLPAPGEIIRASKSLQQPAGGGAVIAAQMAKLVGSAQFFTALGRDELGERAQAELQALGLELHVAWRDAPTRRAVTFIDSDGERTITVIGERLSPTAADPLPWERLAQCDGVFITAADAAAVRLARRARVLAATPRLGLGTLQTAAVPLDLLVGSALDPSEQVPANALDPAPTMTVATEGARGGYTVPGGRFEALDRGAPLGDSYGAGDSFAAGLTTALAAGLPREQALALACRCGAACLDGCGAYGGQLRLQPGLNQG